MTYRQVPLKTWGHVQKLLLVVTALIGLGIVLAPPTEDSRLTSLETFMNVDFWGYAMVVASLLALSAELWMGPRRDTTLVNFVGYMHIICCALMVGYSASNLSGVVARTWWNVGGPAVYLFLAYLHFIYVRRHTKVPDQVHIDAIDEAVRQALGKPNDANG